jgi:DNA gyrase subunit A
MILRMLTDDVRSIGRATQGVTIIDLEENDKVVSIARLAEQEEEAVLSAGSPDPSTEPPPAG